MKTVIYTLYYTIIIAVLVACANPGTPTGGPKDEENPKITKITPENYSTNFRAKRIVIDFDEFVKLKDAAQNISISPPQKKKPKTTLKERRIVVDIRDTLLPNTTYTIDFGSAIADNNEGNPLGEYRYVFSTGDKIDSMGLAGYVRGAQSDSISHGANVALYNPSDTLNPYRTMPQFLAKTDTLGFFMFTNIPKGDYTIFAFEDANKNSMLDADEVMAFLDNDVSTSKPSEAQEVDSVRMDKYTLFQNINIQMRTFKPVETQQYLSAYERPQREKLYFTFNAPREDTLGITLLDTEENPKFAIEKNATQDTLTYWIMNPQVAAKDSLLVQLSYLRSDSLQNWVPYTDTVKLNVKREKKKRKKNEEDEKAIEFMNIGTNMSGRINYYDSLYLEFTQPIVSLPEETFIQLSKKQDSTSFPVEVTLVSDSLFPFRKYKVLTDLEAGATYSLTIDSMQIKDIVGKPNAEIKRIFETYPENYYGKVFVTITGGDERLLLQLIDKSKKTIVAHQRWNETGKIIFENLPPTTYVLKAINDANENGKWDTGDYEKRIQPEEIRFFKKEIELPSNWELEVAWTVHFTK